MYALKASQTLYAALRENALQAVANKLIPDPDQPRHSDRTVDTGVHPVPAKVWAGYSWLEFEKRCSAAGNMMHRERTADGQRIGPLYINPMLVTADIDDWLRREDQTDHVVQA
jgi:hypothetical protein